MTLFFKTYLGENPYYFPFSISWWVNFFPLPPLLVPLSGTLNNGAISPVTNFPFSLLPLLLLPAHREAAFLESREEEEEEWHTF